MTLERLRLEHRIVAQPVSDNEIPATLLTEQVALIKREGLARLHTAQPALWPDPTGDEVEQAAQKRREDLQAQHRASELARVIECEQRGLPRADPIQRPPEELDGRLPLPRPGQSVLIALGAQRAAHVQTSVQASGVHEEASPRNAVFRDLWQRGYCVTSGAKFGGDFLVYEGDPRTHHASMVVLLASADAGLSGGQLTGMVRLATAVRKTTVLASWDGVTDTVSYRTLEFEGATQRGWTAKEGNTSTATTKPGVVKRGAIASPSGMAHKGKKSRRRGKQNKES